MRLMRSAGGAVLVTLAAVCGLVLAQEPAPAPATPAETPARDDAAAASDAGPADETAAADDTAAADETADTAPAPGEDSAKEPAATTAPAETTRKPASATGSPQRFEPTEKVRPDFDVAFPVDI